MGPLAKASSTHIRLALATLLAGCVQHHEVPVQTAAVPPPSATPVQHTGRLWVELGDATWQKQCRAPAGQRLLCFGGVRSATFGALERSLWTSFPDVVLRSGEAPRPGDYVLSLDITIDAMPPDAEGPGWSAVAAGGFRLMRDGKILHGERLGSRSRAAYAYGTPLGIGAGEVVDAFAAHVAQVLSAVPEDRPLRPVALPAVVSEVLTPARTPSGLTARHSSPFLVWAARAAPLGRSEFGRASPHAATLDVDDSWTSSTKQTVCRSSAPLRSYAPAVTAEPSPASPAPIDAPVATN